MLLMRDASWALASERRVVTASATRLERCEKKRQAAPSAAFQTPAQVYSCSAFDG